MVLAVDVGLPEKPDAKLYEWLCELWAVLIARRDEGVVQVLKLGR